MRGGFSGLYGTRVHVVRLRNLNGRGNGTEFTVALKSPSGLESTFFHDCVFVLAQRQET